MVAVTESHHGQRQRKNPKPILEPSFAVEKAEHAGNSKLARALGSCDFHTREKGVAALTRFLKRKLDVTEKDMLKIWKGLFYAFWHSDKLAVQTELAERLSAVLSDLKGEGAYMYFTCFIKTMRREWFGIDRLRLDKFLMLIRKVMGHLFQLMAAKKWQDAVITKYGEFITDNLLLPLSDTYRAVGIAYHVADLFIPELKRVVGEAGAAAPTAEALRKLLDPFCKVLEKADEQVFLTRIREAVFDVLVEEVRSPGEGEALAQLDAPALAADLFTIGAEPETRHRNREILYAVSDALERSVAKRQKKDVAGSKAALQAPDAGQKKKVKPSGAASVAAAPTAAAPPAAAAAPEQQATQGKKKRKAEALSNGVASAPAAGPKPDQEQPAASSAAQAAGGIQSQAGPPSAGKLPGSGKKARLVAGPAAAAADRSPAADAPSTSALKSERKGAQRALDEAAPGKAQEAKAADLTPGSAGKQKPKVAASALKSVAKSGKKKVQINLKKNLYFEFGGPVPPPELRTPQTARSKGGILKQVAAPNSAPAKVGHSKVAAAPQRAGSASASKAGQPRPLTPKGAALRAKAELFF